MDKQKKLKDKDKSKAKIKPAHMTHKEFRELQRQLKDLPPPSFNNPEKVQPTPIVEKVVPASLYKLDTAISEEKNLQKNKFLDPTPILTQGAKLERLHRADKKKQKVIGRFFKFVSKHWFWMALSIVLSLITSALELFVPIFSGKAIDCIVGVGQVKFDELGNILVWLALTAAGYASTRWLTNFTESLVCYKTSRSIREALFKKFNTVPLKYIDGSSQGDLQSRMINDVEDITEGFLEGVTSFIDCLATISLLVFIMFTINIPISATIIALTPISIVATAYISIKSDKFFRKNAKLNGDLSGNIVEMLGNEKVLKAFGYEEEALKKFNAINYEVGATSQKLNFYSSLSGPVARFINGVIYGIVAIMGTIIAAGPGGISIGSISVLLQYANKYVQPFDELSDIFTDVQAAYTAARRVFNVLSIDDEVSDANNRVLSNCDGTVEFKDVNFSYTPTKKLIEGLNVRVENGWKVAIVGPTGCGKSTMINLLMRFYDVNSGTISVSGEPITEVTRASLRDNYGMVLQDTWLFAASIRDNIAYGNPNATQEEVVRAAKLAHVHDFILTMENGYNTMVNENGDNLSQGQKQLICIARIMLLKPKILILDEATSNIDTRTETLIQNAFNTMMQNRTSFVVAHRLSTIINSDLILVMNKGNIIEQGTHAELLKRQGFYYNLYNSQFSKV